ncbi:Sulfatase-modifying factor enzyme domain-containing protein [Desulfonema limicola]|uniref:Sulfatase-modifying factor enzyme domain-containing protein n=2 Tax=Desulfonema limicola TaxID=45656 RepID=A0A975GFV8_9BACT|nr:Sulfatase-modifying factor enzyme domain-containing protein [Desulfonema limicola]
MVSPCFGAAGDVDGIGGVDLKDAVMALQVAAGMNPAGVQQDADVNDSRIGLEEAVYVLRDLADISPGRAQAVLGPLAGADVKVYRLRDLETPVYTDQTEADGYFDTYVSGVNGAEYILVAVSGGQDTDADDNGEPDIPPTPNTGTIHALMTVAEFNAGGFKVTALSDIAWQYAKNLVGQVDEGGLKMRLDDLAKLFFKEDISSDSIIDAQDLYTFMPSESVHKNRLNFDYQILFAPNADDLSVMDCYHRNLPDVLPLLLETHFGTHISLIPAPASRYQKIRIEVATFGRGSVKSNIGGIDVDSSRQNPADDRAYAFFDRSADGKVTLTAAPDSDMQIQSWNGCDSVSEDKTQCECDLRADRLVTLAFGYKETVVREGVTLVDLSNAAVTMSGDMITLDVTASPGDTDMAAELAALKAGDIVVGAADGGFLRKVVSVQKVSDMNCILTTDDAGIGDVIAQGSGGFYKQMTHGDLALDSYSRRSADDAVRLLPSDDPDDRVFRLEIGNPRNARENIEGTLELKTPEGVVIGSLKGTVDITIDVECDASVEWFSLEYLKIIPKITAEESLELTLGAAVEADSDKPLWQKELHTFKFGKIPFQIGILPVYVEPVVTISAGLDGKISAGISFGIKFSQSARAGFVYNKGKSSNFMERFDMVKGFDSSYEPILPKITAIYGELKPYVKTTPSFRIYSVTGPAVALKGYVKLAAGAEAVFTNTCQDEDGIFAAVYAGLEGKFKWEFEKKITKLIGDDFIGKLEFKVFDWEKLIYRKNFFGFCTAPYMEVAGTGISESVTLNSGEVLSQIYTVKNTGQTDMEWDITWIDDGVTGVSPVSGTLSQGQSVPVTVSADTGKLNSAVTYRNKIRFNNKYDAGLIKDQPTGSTSRNVTVSVELPDITAPVMAVPQMAKTSGGIVIPTIVNLSWTYPDASMLDYIDGYVIYMSKDTAGQWQRIAIVTDGNAYQVPNLQTETTYYFTMYAYGYNLSSSDSNTVSIKTPKVTTPPPGGDYTNGLGMSFVELPSGTFMMGSPTDEPGRSSGEILHQVTLTKAFYMMTTEVTQGQWEAVMGTNPSYFTACGGSCPVEQVSWNDIQEFITKMNLRGEGTYRLPTEAEWEYAARAGSTTAFANGGITNTSCTPVDPNLDAMGWYCGNDDVDGSSTTHPVAQKQANAWGLYDMHGNVWEWCQDWYGTYPADAVTDPVGPETGSYRMLRGGSWNFNAQYCRSAYRNFTNPTIRLIHLGLRLVLSQVSR